MSAITVSVGGNIATVTLDRPPVNALAPDTLRAISETFGSLNNRKDIRVAIFTAAGDRAFSAGVDLRARETEEPDAIGEFLDPAILFRNAFWSVYDCAVPVIAAVNGPAIGGGCGLVAMCDVVIASETASFGMTEINVGVLGGFAHLSLLVGRRKARELFLTGELLPARELFQLGAARAVVPPDQLQATARAFAEELAAKSPIALRMAKESANRVEFMPIKEAYQTEQSYTARLRGFADSREARAAYLERRPPDFRFG